MTRPVLVFDVNETLLDIDSLTGHFEDIFGDPAVLREWFGQLVMYSMTVTLARSYVDFSTLGRGVVQMIADARGVTVTDDQLGRLSAAMATMPAHDDVADGLTTLRANGYRIVALTNSPPGDASATPLDNAGLSEFFERQFSVHTCRVFKPDPAVYRLVCRELAVEPGDCTMVAAHVWDTIGAQRVGMQGALITRPGNAVLTVPGVPAPHVIAADIRELAARLDTDRK